MVVLVVREVMAAAAVAVVVRGIVYRCLLVRVAVVERVLNSLLQLVEQPAVEEAAEAAVVLMVLFLGLLAARGHRVDYMAVVAAAVGQRWREPADLQPVMVVMVDKAPLLSLIRCLNH